MSASEMAEFEMRKDDVHVNPRDYLPSTSTIAILVTAHSGPALEKQKALSHNCGRTFFIFILKNS